MTETTPVVKSVDMGDEQQQTVISIISSAYAEYKTSPTAMAGAIKKELDDQLGGPWHVIVGKSFASSISHEKNGFIYAYVDNYAVLAFRTA